MKTYEFTLYQSIHKVYKVRAENSKEAVRKLEERIKRTQNYQYGEDLTECSGGEIEVELYNRDEDGDSWADHLTILHQYGTV